MNVLERNTAGGRFCLNNTGAKITTMKDIREADFEKVCIRVYTGEKGGIVYGVRKAGKG